MNQDLELQILVSNCDKHVFDLSIDTKSIIMIVKHYHKVIHSMYNKCTRCLMIFISCTSQKYHESFLIVQRAFLRL